MSLLDRIMDRAQKLDKTIVLPEGEDIRTIEAAQKLTEQGICKVILLGDEKTIVNNAKGFNIDGVPMINPLTSGKKQAYVEQLVEMRKHKGLTKEQAEQLLQDSVYFGCMMLKNDEVDGLVSGAVHSTGDLLRPALQIIKTTPGISTVSSCFLMEFADKKLGDNGVLIFSDCAVVIDPNEDELAAIAVASAQSAKKIAELDPRVAMLSFSTKGSATHPRVDKVKAATAKAQQLAPQLPIDGELQLDAALVASVGEKKAPGSPVVGKANVLVFPDLDSGNIGYKLTQRLAGATAVGPICQGFAKPVNDLSRGCNADDIMYVSAITALQSEN